MSKTVIAFWIWAAVGLVFLFLTFDKERSFAWVPQTAFGDTSLSRNSVNWLAAIALSGALLICWLSA
jgi:hypothetical protein